MLKRNILKSIEHRFDTENNSFTENDFTLENENSTKLMEKEIIEIIENGGKIDTKETIEKIGKTKHYSPDTKEWANSSYFYNTNYNKTLPIADNIVNKLIKGYLNMHALINNKRSKPSEVRFKRLSLNKLLVSKAEMKHSVNKVTVTVYLYNKNKKFFLYKLKNLYDDGNSFLEDTIRELKDTNNYLKNKIKYISYKAAILMNETKKYKNLWSNTLHWDNSNFLHYKNKYYKNFSKNAYDVEMLHMYYIKMLSVNNNKFKPWFLLGLKKAISKLFNKKVELNFVSLKYLHLNSDIFTESIVTRIRNRENPLLLVLSRALKYLKLPQKTRNINYDTNNFVSLGNKSNDLSHISTLNRTSLKNFETINYRGNTLESVSDLLQFNLESFYTENQIEQSYLKADRLNDKQTNILNNTKFKTVTGVRLEAAGRLSKRLTASRSVFKLRYKGGLRNVDSSRYGISSIILRGNGSSNLQYTLINNKTRNGSFGLKGWISGY